MIESICCREKIWKFALAISVMVATGCGSHNYIENPDGSITFITSERPGISNTAAVYLYRARQALDRNNYEEAIENYTASLKLAPGNGVAYCNRGFAYGATGRDDLAVSDETKAIQLLSKNHRPYVLRGLAYLRQKKNDLAALDFTKAIDLADTKDTDATLYGNRGLAYLRQAKFDRAIKDFAAAIAATPRGPGLARLYYNRSLAHSGNGTPDLALADCAQAIRLSPDKLSYIVQRAILNADQGNHDDAVADLTSILSRSPNKYPILVFRGECLRKQGRYDAALRDLDKAIRLDPMKTPAYYNRALVRTDTKRWDEAIADLTKVISQSKTPDDAYVFRAQAYGQLSKLDLAMSDANKAIEITPSLFAYSVRARLHSQKDDLGAAIKDLTRAIEMSPRSAQSLNERGWALIRAADYKRALLDFDKAIAAEPSVNIYDSRAWAYFHIGDYAKAEANKLTAQRLDPKYSWPMAMEFRIAVARGKHAEAAKAMAISLRSLPLDDDVRPVLEYYLGKISQKDLKKRFPQQWGNYEVAIRGYGEKDQQVATVAVKTATPVKLYAIACDIRVVRVADGSIVGSATGEAKGEKIGALAEALAGKTKEGVLIKGEAIAVVSLRNRSGTKHGQTVADELADKLAGALVDLDWFKVKERLDLRAILDEKDLEKAAVVKNNAVKKKLTNVKYVILGAVTVTETKL